MGEVVRQRSRRFLLPLLLMAVVAALMVPAGASAVNTGAISGTVTDASGAVQNATVTVYDSNGQVDESTATTAANGSYTATGLATGSYLVEVTPPNLSTDVATWYGNTAGEASSTPVAVTNGATTSPTNVTLISGATISGTITGATGTAAGGVVVELYDGGGEYIEDATTASNGTYSITGLAAGAYDLFIDPSSADTTSGANSAEQWYGATGGTSAALDQSNASSISLSAGGSATANETLAAGGVISGTLSDANGAVQGAVAIYSTDQNATAGGASVSSNATTGAFAVYGLPAGKYIEAIRGMFTNAAGASLDDAAGYYAGSSLAPSRAGASIITVTDGATSTAGATLPAAATIIGTVTANGSPVSGAKVAVFDASNDQTDYTATTGPDGSYRLSNLLAGSYKLRFTASDQYAIQFYDDEATLAAANTVSTVAGQTASGKNAALVAAGSISGTVTAAGSNAVVPNATVDLLDSAGNVLTSTTTGQDGTYTIPGLGSGTYAVEFVPPAGGSQYQLQYYGGSQTFAGSTSVTVSPPQATTGINAALTAYTTPAAVQVVALAPDLTSAAPTIRGTATVGKKLTAVTTGWTAGTRFVYQWFAAGRAIPGATAATFTLTGAQYRKTISVVVVGELSGYNWSAVSSLATRAAGEGTLTTKTPTITGLAVVGRTLKATPGAWTRGTRLSYQWYANGRAIARATKASFTLTGADLGRAITVRVTGRLSGYRTAAKTSRPTHRVS